jgi:hypothetical protein
MGMGAVVWSLVAVIGPLGRYGILGDTFSLILAQLLSGSEGIYTILLSCKIAHTIRYEYIPQKPSCDLIVNHFFCVEDKMLKQCVTENV